MNAIICIDRDTIYNGVVDRGVYEYSRIEKKINIGHHTIQVENLNNGSITKKYFWVFTTTHLVVFFESNTQNGIYIEKQYSAFLPD